MGVAAHHLPREASSSNVTADSFPVVSNRHTQIPPSEHNLAGDWKVSNLYGCIYFVEHLLLTVIPII